MNFTIISISLVVIAILCFIGAPLSFKMGMYSDAKTPQLCNDESVKQNVKDPKTCAVWDGVQCRKGKLEGILCASPPNYVLASLIIIGCLSIIGLFIYSFF